MKLLGTHLATLLEQARQASGIRNLVQRLQDAETPQVAALGLVKSANGLIMADGCGLALLDEKTGMLEWVAEYGSLVRDEPATTVVDPLLCQHWEKAVARYEVYDSDPFADFLETRFLDCVKLGTSEPSASIVVILRVRRRPVGLLLICSARQQWFDRLDVSWLRQLVANVDMTDFDFRRSRVRKVSGNPEPSDRQRERLQESLLSQIPLVMWRKDLSGKYTWVNGNFCQSIGRQRNEIIGKRDSDMFPRALAKKYGSVDRTALLEGHYEDSQEPYCPYGSSEQRYIDVVKKAVRDEAGKIIGTQGVFFDVTSDKYRALLDQAPVGFHELEKEGALAQPSLKTGGIFHRAALFHQFHGHGRAAGLSDLGLDVARNAGGLVKIRHNDPVAKSGVFNRHVQPHLFVCEDSSLCRC